MYETRFFGRTKYFKKQTNLRVFVLLSLRDNSRVPLKLSYNHRYYGTKRCTITKSDQVFLDSKIKSFLLKPDDDNDVDNGDANKGDDT